MTDTVELEIGIASTYWAKPPHARVMIDQQIILFDKPLLAPTKVEWKGELEEGIHTLSVDMMYKNNKQTVVKDGKIVKDQLIHIRSLFLDEIDLGDMKWSKSVYHPKPDQKDPDRPKVMKECVDLGWNGRWSFEFSVPTYLWMLENI